MNFFTIGFLLANLQLDLGLWVGYVIKLAGALFMLGGIAEMALVDESVTKLRLHAIGFAVLCAGSAAAVKLLSAEKLSESGDVHKTVSIVCGVLTTAAAGWFFVRLLTLLREKPSIADNVPETARTSAKYSRMLFVLGVVLTADAVNRFTGGTAAADAMGVVMYFTKIISYVYLIACTLCFNKLRISYDSAHPAE